MSALLIYPPPKREAVYSIGARFCRAHCEGIHSPSGFFGPGAIPASRLLPTKLDHVQSKFPKRLRKTPDEFIADHTALAFFYPFASRERLASATHAMRCGGSLHLILGAIAGGKLEADRLRLCPKCAQEDVKTFGFCFWRLEHQFACVLVCSRHETPLLESRFRVRKYARVPSFHEASLNTAFDVIRLDPSHLSLLMRISKSVDDLLVSTYTSLDPSRLAGAILELLKQRGFVGTNEKVRQLELHEEFKRRLPPTLLEGLGCPLRGSYSSDWLAELGRKPKSSLSPIKMILLSTFLGVKISDTLSLGERPIRMHRKPKAGPHPRRILNLKQLRRLRPEKRKQWRRIQAGDAEDRDRAIYSWLWRNDREWLNKTKVPQKTSPKNRRDWPSKDIIVCQEISEASKELKGRYPAVRASRHKLASMTSCPHYLLQGLYSKLPNSLRLLDRVSESSTEFSKRKIGMAVEKTPELLDAPRWKLLKVTGINQASMPESVILQAIKCDVSGTTDNR